jgi:hypothetical protein
VIPELLGLAALATATMANGPKSEPVITLLFEMPRSQNHNAEMFLVLNLTEGLLLTWVQRLDRLRQIREENQELLGKKWSTTIDVPDRVALFRRVERLSAPVTRDQQWLTGLIEKQREAIRLRKPHDLLFTGRKLRMALKLKRFGEVDGLSPDAKDRLITAKDVRIRFVSEPSGQLVNIEARSPFGAPDRNTFSGIFFEETLVDLLSILRESQL